ncbi:rCG58988, partial [Rattus norvegicus]
MHAWMHTHIRTSIYTKDQLLLKYFKHKLFYSHPLTILFLHFYTAF